MHTTFKNIYVLKNTRDNNLSTGTTFFSSSLDSTLPTSGEDYSKIEDYCDTKIYNTIRDDPENLGPYLYKFLYNEMVPKCSIFAHILNKNLTYNLNFHPDVNGFYIIAMIPPHLSGYPDEISNLDNGRIAKTFNKSTFLSLDVNPPEISIESSTVDASNSNSVIYGINRTAGNNINISYIENRDLEIFNSHSLWIEYIRQVLLGDVSPQSQYLNDASGHILLDYATSCYIIKYLPNMDTVVYVGKAVGLFPQSVTTKDVIGSRNSPTISMVNINYSCADYYEFAMGEHVQTSAAFFDNYTWLLQELESIYIKYGT